MKYKLLLPILLSISMLSSCDTKLVNHKMTIFVASDIHLLSSNLVSNEKKATMTSDGRAQEYDYDLVNALVKEVNEKKPKAVFLTGDLTFNGEKDSHQELVKLLDKVNKDTKALVIPGNHDLYNVNSKDYNTNSWTSNLEKEDFLELYKEYGYVGGLSYDTESLSYIYDLGDNNWVLMLDTTLSKYNYEFDYNYVGGYLEESTLSWIEDNLKIAKERGINVICSAHHNLALHNPYFKNYYQVGNYLDLASLLTKYNVSLYFSGHLHIQSIKEVSSNDKVIYDIASSSLLDYGNNVGVLDIYENGYDYKTLGLEVDDIEDFRTKSFNIFYSKYVNKSKSNYEKKYGEGYESVLDFSAKANCYYFDGDYEAIHKLIKENKDIYNLINKTESNTYIQTIFDIENKSQKELMIKK